MPSELQLGPFLCIVPYQQLSLRHPSSACSELWEKWQEQGDAVEGGTDGQEYDAFIESLLQQPEAASQSQEPSVEPEDRGPDDLPGRKRAPKGPSVVVRPSLPPPVAASPLPLNACSQALSLPAA